MAVVRALIEAGADVDKATTDEGLTPASIAAYRYHFAVVRVLKDAEREDMTSPPAKRAKTKTEPGSS